MTDLRKLDEQDIETATAFLNSLPERDRTFFKEDVTRERVERWAHDPRAQRWILWDEGRPAAMLAIVSGVGWSSHVGELRLVVAADFRRRGIGRRLARFGLTEAVRLGLRKIIVEVAADKEGDIEMFTSIGFRPEALLQDHICDSRGVLHDLVLLAHSVEDVSASMDALGIGRAVGTRGES